jgi:hypothetical protein
VFRVDVGSENRSKLAGAATGNKIAHVELPGVLCRVMITYTEKSTNEAPRSDGEWALFAHQAYIMGCPVYTPTATCPTGGI